MTDEQFLNDIKENYQHASEAWQEIYAQAKDDMNFVYDVGEGQWPTDVKNARGNRPMLTINKLQKFVRQLRGDQAQNRPRVKVIPVDNSGDVRKAELYNGLIRKIEYQ